MQATEHSPILLSRDEIEQKYGITRRWLELAAWRGDGPPMIKVGNRMVRYRRTDFEDWLRARTIQHTDGTAA